MLAMTLTALIGAGLGVFLLIRLDVLSKERTPVVLVLVLGSFIAAVILAVIVGATTSGVSISERIGLPLILGVAGMDGILIFTALYLWVIDHTFWGRVNVILFSLEPMSEVARRKPMVWLSPMFLPRDKWARGAWVEKNPIT